MRRLLTSQRTAQSTVLRDYTTVRQLLSALCCLTILASFLIYTPDASAAGSGLLGNYYDNSDFTGTKVSRVDATVNFNWGSGAPISGIGVDTFSVRWTGQVQPLYSQTYTFYTNTDDGTRLWVNGVQLVNDWNDHGPTERSGTIALTANQLYDIRFEYYDSQGGALAQLSWSSSSQAKQIIPQSQLYPTPPAAAAGDVLQLAVTNDSSAGANRYIYKKFSNASYTFQSGDYVEYDVKLLDNLPGAGGIEIYATDGSYFRDAAGWSDQNGVEGHPRANLAPDAYNMWFHRRLRVPSSLIGKTASHWDLVGENDSAALSYSAQYDNFLVTNGSGTLRKTVFANAADQNASGDVIIAGVSSSTITVVNLSGPAAPTAADLIDNNLAFIKLDKTNTSIGAGFNMHFISTVWINGTLWTYYIKQTPAAKLGIGLAKSTDGVNFTDQGLVLDVGSPGQWDDTMSSFPGIYYDGATFYLVYEGTGAGSPGDVGLATSTNGVNFTRYSGNPLIRHNTTGWESANIGTPSLYKEGSTWYVFYHGYDGTDCRIGVATGASLTTAGLTKSANNPIINTSSSGWDSGTTGKRGTITKIGSSYYMVFEGSTDQPYDAALWSSGFARSNSLTSGWTKFSQNNVLPQVSDPYGNDGPELVQISGVTWIYYRRGHQAGTYTRRARIASEASGGFDLQWNSQALQHVTGRAYGTEEWEVIAGTHPANFMQYGPYTTAVPVGDNIATWKLMVDNNTADNNPIVRLEVVDATSGGTVLASRDILRTQWKATYRYEYFSVPFTLDSSRAGHQLELRIWWYGNSYVRQHKVGIS